MSTVAIYIPIQRQSGRTIPEHMTEKAIHKAKAVFTRWGHTLCYEASFSRQDANEKGYVEQRVMVVECQTPHVAERFNELVARLEILGGDIVKDLRLDKIYVRSPNGDIDPVA